MDKGPLRQLLQKNRFLKKQKHMSMIKMANAMVDDGMEEGRAISIATAKARDYVSGGDNSSRPHYVVKAHEDDWILMKQDGERAIKTATTKESLLEFLFPCSSRFKQVVGGNTLLIQNK